MRTITSNLSKLCNHFIKNCDEFFAIFSHELVPSNIDETSSDNIINKLTESIQNINNNLYQIINLVFNSFDKNDQAVNDILHMFVPLSIKIIEEVYIIAQLNIIRTIISAPSKQQINPANKNEKINLQRIPQFQEHLGKMYSNEIISLVFYEQNMKINTYNKVQNLNKLSLCIKTMSGFNNQQAYIIHNITNVQRTYNMRVEVLEKVLDNFFEGFLDKECKDMYLSEIQKEMKSQNCVPLKKVTMASLLVLERGILMQYSAKIIDYLYKTHTLQVPQKPLTNNKHKQII